MEPPRISFSRLLGLLLPGFLVFHFLLVSVAFAGQANVFIYHRFNDSRYPSTNTSSTDFLAHLDLLSQKNYVVLTLGEVVDKLKEGEPLPERCAVITVDDAYRSFLTNAWPLLKQYGYRATLFVSTDTVGEGDYLGWQELESLWKEGVEMGNHSASHAYLLDRLMHESDADWSKRVTEDLRRSQRAFEAHLGFAPRLFAYPYGEFAPELTALVKSEGFHAAFGQQSGVVADSSDLFRLPRFPVGGDYAAVNEFREKLLMKPLAVQVVSPETTILEDENPPRLRFHLRQDHIDASSLRCYVTGQTECMVRTLDGEDGFYEVVAVSPLSGRRSKYTLTAKGLDGNSWYWFSQLWLRPGGRELTD